MSTVTSMGSSFVALLSASEAAMQLQTDLIEHSSLPSLSSRQLLQVFSSYDSPSSPNLPGVRYITSNQLLGVMVMLLLLSVLLVGVTALMSVQRPVRMTKQHLQIPKEY